MTRNEYIPTSDDEFSDELEASMTRYRPPTAEQKARTREKSLIICAELGARWKTYDEGNHDDETQRAVRVQQAVSFIARRIEAAIIPPPAQQ